MSTRPPASSRCSALTVFARAASSAFSYLKPPGASPKAGVAGWQGAGVAVTVAPARGAGSEAVASSLDSAQPTTIAPTMTAMTATGPRRRWSTPTTVVLTARRALCVRSADGLRSGDDAADARGAARPAAPRPDRADLRRPARRPD